MGVFMRLFILKIFCQSVFTAKPSIEISRLIFDLTRPVNELVGGEISEEDFIYDVNSAFDLIGANNTSTVFYAIAGSTIEELESRTQEACQIVHEILKLPSDSQLLVSWTMNGDRKDKLNISLPYNQTFDGCKPKLVLHFNEETGCDEQPGSYFRKTIQELVDFKHGMFAGVSYDELLHECDSIFSWRWHASISVVNFKFGATRGVTESFGLFKTRMKFLSETIEFKNPNKTILYYPNPYGVGKNEHQKLLVRYASIWTASNETKGSLLLQVPNFKNKASEMAQFSIIPKFRLQSITPHSHDKDILSSLLWYAASFQRHQMIFVNQLIWELWNGLPEDNIRSPQIRDVVSSIDLPLDCSWVSCVKPKRTTNHPSRLNAGNPTTFVIEIMVEGGLPSLPVEIAERISPNSTIGCALYGKEKYFQSLNESNVEHVVRSCQSVSGSVYILTARLTLEWYNELGKYSFFFENTIRKELHAVNRFRKGILEKAPSAKVYFGFVAREQRGSSGEFEPQSKSLFCNELAPTVNLYFEGIFNWARLENFPVIKHIYNKDAQSYFSEWSLLLRRLNYPYPDWALNLRKRDEVTSSSVGSPAFLMQDYLKTIHNWEPDACIDWIEKRWEIDEDIFKNPNIGTVFHPNSILKNRALKEDDSITMLHFIFNRFNLVEINVSNSFSTLLEAIEHFMTSQDSRAEIYMNYALTYPENQKDVMSFIDHLKKSTMLEKGWLKGVHAELVVQSGMNSGENISISTNFDSVSRMMKYAKLSNLTCGIELPSVNMCNQMLQKFTFSDEYTELIGTVNYILCKETFSTLTWSYSKLELQNLLDSHLALKRTLDLMIPHLRLYFRVEFDFEIDFKNAAELDKYTSFLVLFKTFGTQYDISYFVVVAFDGELIPKKNGWWGITNYSELTNPQSYVEKVTDFRGQKMWYPATLPKSILANNQDSSLIIIFSSVSSAVLICMMVIGIWFGLRYRKLQYLSRFLSDSEVQEFLNGRMSANVEHTNMNMELIESAEHMKFNQEFKLHLPNLIIDFEKILGSGAFGTVYKGLTKDVPAAIKSPNGDCSKTTFKSVLTEVKVLSYVGNHPNVVKFLGAYIEEIHKGVLYISTELCALGSLESFLRKKNKVASELCSNQDQRTELDATTLHLRDLNTFSLDIAKGMEYIESRRVVHGDLATRNVLLDENLVCKIGDFGLSRKLYEYQKYVKSSQEPLPWKWMAPESLTKMEFTSKTDLWSYGVTIWEIYSLGNIPYSGLNWTVDFAKELKNGLRLPSPDFASPEIYAKLLECWSFIPDERPSFADMIQFFNGLSEADYMVLNSTEQ